MVRALEACEAMLPLAYDPLHTPCPPGQCFPAAGTSLHRKQERDLSVRELNLTTLANSRGLSHHFNRLRNLMLLALITSQEACLQ